MSDIFILPDIAAKDLPPQGVKPRIFISYSTGYVAQVAEIVRRLENTYYDVWFDKRDIAAGKDWQREIAKGVQSANLVLFFMSPESCASSYCRGEIAHAIKYKIRIIPIRINLKTPDNALQDVGLEGSQFIDWADTDSERNWQRLINDHSMVKPPLAREIHRLDPNYERQHRRYLKTFFRPDFSRVSLSDISTDSPIRGVPLKDIYVPLSIDMTLYIQVDKVDKKTVENWWIPSEESEKIANKNIPDKVIERALRYWRSLGVNENGLKVLISNFERQLVKISTTDNARGGLHTWHLQAIHAANVQSHMVLTGIPGSGKSTFLKHLALCLAGDQLKDEADISIQTLSLWALPAYTPIFIRLADLVKQQFPNRGDKADTEDFERYIKNFLENKALNDYWNALQEQLYDGSAIILLDGLDEVPNAVEQWRREQITDFIAAVINEYRKCRIIISSRPYAYSGDWKLVGFGQTALIPFDIIRTQKLALALFKQISSIDDADMEANAFINALEPRNKDNFWNNPLQLTMGASLWLRHTDQPIEVRIPSKASELYDKSVELLLEKWAKRDPVLGASVAELLGVTTVQLRTALERLALDVQTNFGSDNKASFKQWALIEHIEDCVREDSKGKTSSLDYNNALDLLEQRAGLLISEEARHYRFQHLSYQEYLAACELVKPKHFPRTIIEKLQTQIGRWRNVVPLLWDMLSLNQREELASALIPDSMDVILQNVGSLELIQFMNQQKILSALNTESRNRLRLQLLLGVENDTVKPPDRAMSGRILGVLGDPRAGISLEKDIPDILWLYVAASNGKVEFVGDEGLFGEFEIKPFYIGKYLITNLQYQAFVAAEDGYNDPRWWSEIPKKYKPRLNKEYIGVELSNFPTNIVSWYESMAFISWLNYRLEGTEPAANMIVGKTAEIRLPTEWEWQWVAQNGAEKLEYPWGDGYQSGYANIDESWGNRGIFKLYISPVGCYPQGVARCGALDMTGNVWEWCLNDYESPQIISDYSVEPKVLRGGSFLHGFGSARSSFRNRGYPYRSENDIGFRLVLASHYPLSS